MRISPNRTKTLTVNLLIHIENFQQIFMISYFNKKSSISKGFSVVFISFYNLGNDAIELINFLKVKFLEGERMKDIEKIKVGVFS